MGWTLVTVGHFAHYGAEIRTDIDYRMMKALCEYCKIRGYEGYKSVDDGLTRMIQVLTNYYNDGIVIFKEITITSIKWLEVYAIYDWEIETHFRDGELVCEEKKVDVLDLLFEIDETSPEPLGEVYIREHYKENETVQKSGEKKRMNEKRMKKARHHRETGG